MAVPAPDMVMDPVQIVTPGIYITVPPDEDAQGEQQSGAVVTAGTPTLPGPGILLKHHKTHTQLPDMSYAH
jgi:hypothetical protein